MYPRVNSRGRGFKPQPPRPQYDNRRRFEEEEQPFLVEKKKNSKQQRDEKRRDDFREKKGKETMDNLKKELDKELFFGFTMDSKAFEGQKIGVSPQAKILPISTRSVGLTTQAMFVKVNQTMRNIPQCSVYEAYRVSLAQMEYKVIESGRNQLMNVNTNYNDYQALHMALEYREALLGCPINFNVIASAINAVGSFEYNQIQYYCKIPNRAVPDPLTVSFSNLKRTVSMMSLESTPIATRKYFYENNPLPGAKWKGVAPPRRGRRDEFEINPILTNPQDFWPVDYGIEDFNDDLQRFNGLLSWTSRKSLKYVNVESKIVYSGSGSPTCFVSNYCEGLRNSDPLLNADGSIDWQNTAMPVGRMSEFWTPDRLDDMTMYIGMLQLLGEIPGKSKERFSYVRSVENCVMRADRAWTAMFINMMG